MISGVKRPLEAPSAPEGPIPDDDDVATAAAEAAAHAAAAEAAAAAAEDGAAPTGDVANAAAAASASAALGLTPNPLGQEEAALKGEVAWLRQQNEMLKTQLATIQVQHGQLMAQANAQIEASEAAQAAAKAQSAAAPAAQPHSQAWTLQVHPEHGQTYYWNSKTQESTYEKPPDFNPGAHGATSSHDAGIPQTKGPPGANLFVVRKMRRGEYDEFDDHDLIREFGKYGVVTKAEMTIDKENGWSRGFGFVSLATVAEAEAAIEGVNGQWLAGREMKVEKTHDN